MAQRSGGRFERDVGNRVLKRRGMAMLFFNVTAR